MIVRENINLAHFDNHRWLISTEGGHNILVNDATAKLFRLLQDTDSFEKVRLQFNHDFQSSLSLEELTILIESKFGGYGILTFDQSVNKVIKGSNYLKIRFELLSSKASAVFAAPLQLFYNPYCFWIAFPCLLLFLLGIHIMFPTLPAANRTEYWIAILLIYASLPIHELGHIAACGHFGVRHGGIGLAFYLYVLPVLYADVANIWQVDRQRRIITNLGGIFSQLLYASLLAGLYISLRYAPLLFAAMTVVIMAIWQLNPFVRHDGYWLLSDLTNTQNLQTKSSTIVKLGLSQLGMMQIIHSRGKSLLSRNGLLFLYGIANTCLLLAFMGFAIVSYGDRLVQFPSLIVTLSGKFLSGSITFFDIEQISPIVLFFYILIIRYLTSVLVKYFRNSTVQDVNT